MSAFIQGARAAKLRKYRQKHHKSCLYDFEVYIKSQAIALCEEQTKMSVIIA